MAKARGFQREDPVSSIGEPEWLRLQRDRPDEFIVNDAHNVIQALPLSAKQYACMDCGLRGDLETLFGAQRCYLKLAKRRSGWIPAQKK